MRSLQARLLWSSAVAAILATALAGWAIAAVLDRFVVAGLDGRLDAELALLASAVDEAGGIDRARLDRAPGGLVSEPGWRWRIVAPSGVAGTADLVRAASPVPPALPFVGPAGPVPAAPPVPDDPVPAGATAGVPALPGAVAVPPAGGRGAAGSPLSGIAPAEGAAEGLAREPRPDERPPPPAPGGPRPLDGADRGSEMHARVLFVPTRRGPAMLLAEAPRAVVRRPIRDALIPLLSALASLLGLLAVAAVVQLRVGLAPVRRLRDQLEAIRAGDRETVDENQPSELLPLAVALNALAADNRAALAAARRSGANLAHALKTPVAVLALDLRDDPERAAQLARIDETIRHHLHRARMETVGGRVGTALGPALDGVLGAIRHLHAERALLIETEAAEGLRVLMDPQDLDELLGNLLDNAARHARRRIRVRAGLDPADRRAVLVAIEDDGPGIPADQRERVLQRGARLDERGGGHGFGLAIVAETLALHGGRIALGERPGGGLAVQLRMPGRSER